MDQRRDAERGREVLTEILARMGVDASIEVQELDERIVLDIRGAEAALVIGKKGQTLDALQYLVGKIVHKGQEVPGKPFAGKPIVVDAEGYRARHEDSLIALAHRLSNQAIRTRRPVAVDPMSPSDRRVIHMTLADVPGVTTRSEGEGAFRRLMIIPSK